METGLFKRLRTAIVAEEINYVQSPLVETAIIETGWYDVAPTNNPPIDGQPISFDYKGNPNWYIDMDHSRVEFRVKITKKDGSDLVDADKVGPINLLAHTMFRRCATQVNSVDVSPNDNNYAQKAFMSHLITHTHDMNKNISKLFEGWEGDAPVDHYGSVKGAENTGLGIRIGTHKLSKESTFLMLPNDGIWMQPLDLFPRFDLKLTYDRNGDEFSLMEEYAADAAATGFKLKITYAVLHLRYKVLRDDVVAGHRKELASPDGMVLHLKAAQLKLFSIPQGASTHTIQGVYSGLLPPMLLMAMVNSEAANGSYKTNPFYFRNFGCESIDLQVNGKTCNGRPLRPKFGTSPQYLFEYFCLLDEAGFAGRDHLDINPEQWAKCCNLWLFETAPFAAQIDVLQNPGGINLEIRFSTATTEPITLISLGQKYETVRLRDNLTVEYYRDVS